MCSPSEKGPRIVEIEGEGTFVVVDLHVGPEGNGRRLDHYLAGRLARFSRARIQRMIRKNKVLVDGEVVTKPSFRVHKGQTITIYRLAPKEEGEARDLPVLHEGEGILVLSKPAGVTVHPTASVLRNTVTWFLNHREGPAYGPAHRLDRETSGALVCAEKGDVSAAVKGTFAQGRVGKAYLALVRGRIDAPMAIDAPLLLDDSSEVMVRMRVDGRGLPSRTVVVPLASSDEASLVVCLLETGRQHQIRVHLEHAGHPLWGDKLYGHPDEVFLSFVREGMTEWLLERVRFTRQMLHSYRIAFHHPLTGTLIDVTAPLPQDFIEAARSLGLSTDPLPALPESAEEWLFKKIQ